MKKNNKFVVLFALIALIFASCASTKVTSQAKTPVSAGTESSVPVQDAK